MQGPQIIVGSRQWIALVRGHMDRLHERQFEDAFLAALPTHVLETADGLTGYGRSWAEAFSDLVKQHG